ncbi:MAG: tetratricopeptide repeat protein [Pseudomonadota bacterium]
MSDIFQEVEEDLRRERLKRIWDRYGIFVIAGAVLIVLVTAGFRGYDAWKTGRERAAGDEFAAVLAQAQELNTVSVADELVAFGENAPGGYAMLADFRAGTAYAEAGESEQAQQVFRALAEDTSVPAPYRDLAGIRLGHLLIDAGDYDAARDTLLPIAENTGNPFHRSAQELVGLAAFSSGDTDEALRWFTALREEAGTPPAIQGRAQFMLGLIAQTVEVEAPANGGTPAASEEETN